MVDHLKNVFVYYTSVRTGKSILKKFFVRYAELFRFPGRILGKLTMEVIRMDRHDTVPNFDPDGLLGLKEMQIASDVLGSYTGRMKDLHEVPVQDADDL